MRKKSGRLESGKTQSGASLPAGAALQPTQ